LATNSHEADAIQPVEPAESRTFSIVESVVLIAGFGVAAGVLSYADNWPRQINGEFLVLLLIYLAFGLSLGGPILVSWRERLGRRRPVWGLGESLWFAIGLLAQDVALSAVVMVWFGGELTALSFIVLIFVLPMIYLTGNPKIELSRAPFSWSNIVGLLNIAMWLLTGLVASQVR